jgi:uncharacterized protein
MKKVRLGRTELRVSEIAFGGIPIQRLNHDEAIAVVRDMLEMGVNFLDTAHGYTTSEERIGEAIRDIPRESLVLASKSPASDRDGFMRDLELSLRRLDVEYIDIYQHHNVSGDAKMSAVLGPGGAWEGMQEALESGLIRHPAFSAHSLDTAEKMMRTGNYEVIQLPFNFVDDAAAELHIPLARELDMGFICMKPLGGGLLDDARLCFRFLRQFDGIVPDPGIEASDQMREILAVYSDTSPLSRSELAEIEEVKAGLGKSWCHRCDYCQPCPQNIRISTVLSARSMTRRMPLGRTREILDPAMEAAASCIECGLCVERCPYDLAVPELLKERQAQYGAFIGNGVWG